MANQTLWLNISIQQIQIFLKSVELKNFTKAANDLNFSPSMISKTITSLENELGLQLFSRKPHEITPTPAGLILAAEWRQLVGSFSNGIKKARSYQDELFHNIVFSIIDSSDAVDHLISQAVRHYLRDHPHMQITVEKHDMHRAAELLNMGLLDIALTSEMEVPYLDGHEIPWEKTCKTHVAAYVSKDNALFERESIEFKDLEDQPLLSLDPQMHPSYSRFLFSVCSRHGISPSIISTFRTVRSLIFNLKLRNGVFIGDSINAAWCDENLKMFPLPEVNYSIIAWQRTCSQEILAFKDYIKELYVL